MRGAFTALAGMLVAPLAVVLALTALYGQFAQVPSVTGALRGMSAVAAGLIIATALKLLATVKLNPMGLPTGLGFAALIFIATALLHWPLVRVIFGLGACAIAVAWRWLRPP